jgi:hypothetical protein
VNVTAKTILSLVFAVSFAANTAHGSDSSASSNTPSAPIISPAEFDWTFYYRGRHYGLQQFGPVAIYPRNTHIIWRSRAYRIPVTVPWAVVIAGFVAFVPFGFIAFRKKGKSGCLTRATVARDSIFPRVRARYSEAT